MTGVTTDRNDPGLRQIEPSGMQATYLVLSEEERAKGFVRKVFDTYTHLKCGSTTTMGHAIAETYARDPKYYGGTFCCVCGTHFPLKETGAWKFLWPDGTPVGSTEVEGRSYLEAKNQTSKSGLP